MPKLRASCGPSLDKLQTIPTNYDESPVHVESDLVDLKITARIRDFLGDVGERKERKATAESGYFEEHKGLTWSMAIQGRFKEEVNADDVLYGNVFESSIRDHLPYGTAAALKFVNFVDPSLEQDIYSDKPWALSPLIATMNYMHVTPLESEASELPAWNPKQPEDDVLPLFAGKDDSHVQQLKGNANGRRSWFANKQHRQEVTISPKDHLSLDFCNGYLDFNTFALKLPGGLSFSLLKYWDGQPVTYICTSRDRKKVFFYIVFEIIDEEARKKVGLSGPSEKKQEPSTSTPRSDEEDLDVD